jgi:hypothetical protein
LCLIKANYTNVKYGSVTPLRLRWFSAYTYITAIIKRRSMLKKFKSFSIELSEKQLSIIKSYIGEDKFEETVKTVIDLRICEFINNYLVISKDNESYFETWSRVITSTDDVCNNIPCYLIKDGVYKSYNTNKTCIQFIFWFALPAKTLFQLENFSTYTKNCKIDDKGTLMLDYDHASDIYYMMWLDQNYYLSNFKIIDGQCNKEKLN